MITYQDYGKNPYGIINHILVQYGAENSAKIILHFEMSILKNQIQNSVMTLRELSDRIDSIVERLYDNNFIFQNPFAINEDMLFHYMKVSIIDIIAFGGKAFGHLHTDMIYPLTIVSKATSSREFNEIVQDLYFRDLYMSDVLILEYINNMYVERFQDWNVLLADASTSDLCYYALIGDGFFVST